jgi:hypothetical protein
LFLVNEHPSERHARPHLGLPQTHN